MQSHDSYQTMLDAVQAFHDKHDFKNQGGKEMLYRIALMMEELAEETADLFILLISTAISADFDLKQAFWQKMNKIMQRESKIVNGRIRVSKFRK